MTLSTRSAFAPLSPKLWADYFRDAGPAVYAIFLVAISGRIFEERAAGEVLSGSLNSANMFRALLVATAAFLVLLILPKVRRVFSGPFLFFLLYALVCLCSSLWSSSPLVTFAKAGELLVGTLAILCLILRQKRVDALNAVGMLLLQASTIMVMAITALFFLQVPGFVERGGGGLSDLLGGVRSTSPFLSANSVGYTSAVLILSLWAFKQTGHIRNGPWAAYTGVLVLALLCSGSRTSLGLTIGGLCAIWLIRRGPALGAVLAAFAGIVLYFAGPTLLDLVQGSASERNLWSFTGRTELWSLVQRSFLEEPLLGYGYGIGFRATFHHFAIASMFDNSMTSAHNGFLEAISDVGLLGFVPFFISVIGVSRYIFTSTARDTSPSPLAAAAPYIAIALIGATCLSSTLGGSLSPLSLLFILLAAYTRTARLRAKATP